MNRPTPPYIPAIHPDHPRRWTPLRQRVFLLSLAQSGCVEAAARRAGMSRQAAYRLRARRADIAGVWDLAVSAAWLGRQPGAPDAGLHKVTQGDAR